jgi:hypothetical protein
MAADSISGLNGSNQPFNGMLWIQVAQEREPYHSCASVDATWLKNRKLKTENGQPAR